MWREDNQAIHAAGGKGHQNCSKRENKKKLRVEDPGRIVKSLTAYTSQ